VKDKAAKPPNHAWFALADAKHCRLLRCERTPAGTPTVREMEALENTWPGHDHVRPSPLAAKNGHTHASWHHEVEEDLRRFAQQVAGWLKERFGQHGIDRLYIFAAPRFLGELRKLDFGPHGQRMEQRDGELMWLTPGDLARHPAIRALLERPA